ncbi:MAG: hypothetical protein AB1776_06130 [Bacillota bacterium]
MKIGAGGLQSLAAHDAIAARKVDPALARPVTEEDVRVLGTAKNAFEQLVRLVEQLNQLAAAYNYPFRFRVREEEKGKPRVEVEDRKSGKRRLLEPEEFKEVLDELKRGAGWGLDAEV